MGVSLECVWILIHLGLWKYESPAESPAESPPEEQSPGVAVFQELGITVALVYFIQEIAEGK